MRALPFLCLFAAALVGAETTPPEPALPPARIPVSWIDTKAALSAITLHRGLVLAPLGEDHGGGKGAGALAAYDLRDPAKPVTVFDSRDHRERYHTPGGRDYLGDCSEYHHGIISGDRMILAERRPGSSGFLILDLAPLYDQDPETLPAVVCRYTFPGVNQSTNYDGFSFALEWAGGRYVYAPTGSHGLFVIDTADPTSPQLIAHLPNARLANQVLRSAVALGDLLVVTPVAVGINGATAVILDIADPRHPTVVNTFRVSMGYQGFLYGSRFFNVATAADRNHVSRLLSWDLSDPRAIRETVIATSTFPSHPEYGFGKDGDLFLGHYAGLMRWSLGGPAPAVVDRVEPTEPPKDDYAFISPAGPLVVATSDHRVRSRLNVAPLHTPDVIPPTLLHSRPADGATAVARTAGIGLAFSDFLDTATLPSALRLRKAGSDATIPATISHLAAMVNVVPAEPLDADSTYEVVADGTLLRDQVGNRYQGPPVLLHFSTGAVLTPYNIEIRADRPRPVGSVVSLSLGEVAPAGTRLEHAWDFGDKTPVTPFSSATTVEHRFAEPGNHTVTVLTRRVGEQNATRTTGVQVVHRPLADRRGLSSGTITLDPQGGTVFAVNPDHGTVAALDARTLVRRWESAIGPKAAAVAFGGDGRVWATSQDGDSVVVLDAASGARKQEIRLPTGSAPVGVVVTGGLAYVACSGSDTIQEIDSVSGALLRRVAVADPRHLAWDPRRNRLVVPRFLSRGGSDGQVSIIDCARLTVLSAVGLAPSPGPDSGADGSGSPNYLASPAISPDLAHAWLPGKKDNIGRGPRRDGRPLTFDHTVRSLGVRVDLERQREDVADRLDFDNSDFTTAAVFSPLGNLVFFASLGSRSIWAVDAYDDHDRFSFDAGGEGPIGLAMAPDGSTLYVHHLLTRSVAAIDIAGVVAGDGLVGGMRSGSTAAKEVLPADVLAGKRLFHDSVSPELSQEGYMSCAACHFDGSHDGRVWDLSQFGEGLRNTIDLRGRAGTGHGPLHWSGNFDEVQDFNNQLRALNQGQGLIAEQLLAAHGRAVERPDGDPKAGLSPALDQLAAYVASLDRMPANGARPAAGLSPAAQRGRGHFIALDCMTCHRGPAFTDSAPGVRHDVGTLSATSGQRLGRTLDGLDTPTLLGLDRSAPYLHDGSAATLMEVLTTRNPSGRHGDTARLSAVQREELVAFLRELGPGDAPTPADVATDRAAPVIAAREITAVLAADATPGQTIATVRATLQPVTPRTGPAAVSSAARSPLRYRLAQGSDAGFFSIDAATGVLGWVGAVPARKPIYRLTVVAEDDGRLPVSATCAVTVRLDWPAPDISRTTAGRDKTALRVAWLGLGSGAPVHIQVGPLGGPFRTIARQTTDPLSAGTQVAATIAEADAKAGTHLRLMTGQLDADGSRLEVVSSVAALPATTP